MRGAAKSLGVCALGLLVVGVAGCRQVLGIDSLPLASGDASVSPTGDAAPAGDAGPTPQGDGSVTPSVDAATDSGGAGPHDASSTHDSGSDGSATSNDSGAPTERLACPAPCQASASCSGTCWASGKAACDQTAPWGATANSLYASSNSPYGVWQIQTGTSYASVPVFGWTDSMLAEGLALTATTPSLAFACVDNNNDLFDGTEGASGEAPLPTYPGSSLVSPFYVQGLTFSNGTLFMAASWGMTAFPYPPSSSGWAAASWGFGLSNGPNFSVYQTLAVGGGMLVAATSIGAVVIAAATGDICYTQSSTSMSGDPGGTNGNSIWSGAAVDSDGNIFLVGTAGSDGVIEEINAAGACTSLFSGSSGCSALGTAWSCGTGCAVNSTLTNTPLVQAAYVGGELYVTELKSLAGAGGGALDTWTLAAGGLNHALADREYYALVAGP